MAGRSIVSDEEGKPFSYLKSSMTVEQVEEDDDGMGAGGRGGDDDEDEEEDEGEFSGFYGYGGLGLKEEISDMESENQVLRQQSLSSSPVKSVSEVSQTLATPKLLNCNLESVNYKVDVMNPSP
ncbi:hypothetical protein Droror1_Dr00024217 [Drosera rotundifolia]